MNKNDLIPRTFRQRRTPYQGLPEPHYPFHDKTVVDREHQAHGQAVKDIYVYPLVPHARQRLCGILTL